MSPRIMLVAVLGAALLAPTAHAQTAKPDLKPSEAIWKPAPTPPGGVAWQVLETAKEDPAAAKAGARDGLKPVGGDDYIGVDVLRAPRIGLARNGTNGLHQRCWTVASVLGVAIAL